MDFGLKLFGNLLGAPDDGGSLLVWFRLEVNASGGNDLPLSIMDGDGHVIDFLPILFFLFDEGVIGRHGGEFVLVTFLANAFGFGGGDGHACVFARGRGRQFEAQEFWMSGGGFFDKFLRKYLGGCSLI